MYGILRCIYWETEPAKGLRVMNGWQGARLKLCFIRGLWGQEEQLLGRAGSWRRKIRIPGGKESSNLRIIKPHSHTSFWQLHRAPGSSLLFLLCYILMSILVSFPAAIAPLLPALPVSKPISSYISVIYSLRFQATGEKRFCFMCLFSCCHCSKHC